MAEHWLQPGDVVRGSARPTGVAFTTAKFTATATREPDGSIATSVEAAPQPAAGGKGRVAGWPLIRGIVDLAHWGTGPIMQMLVFAFVAVCPFLFVVAEWAPRGRMLGLLLAAGALAYPFWTIHMAFRLVPKLGDWNHYHAAEHQAIFCMDKDQPLTVENAAAIPPIDPRCGSGDTAWWILGMWLLLPLIDLWWPAGWMAALVEPIPVVLLGAAVGGEINAVVRDHHDARWVWPLTWPAWWVQRTYTMGHAKSEHLEVAIAAIKVLAAASTTGVDQDRDGDG